MPVATLLAGPPNPGFPKVELVLVCCPVPKVELVLACCPVPPNKLNWGFALINEVDPNIFLLAFSSLGLLPSPLKKPPPPPVLLATPKPEELNGDEVASCDVVLVGENSETVTADDWPNPIPLLEVPLELETA